MTGPGPNDPADQAPPPAAPEPAPPAQPAQPAAEGNWGQQGTTPDWAEKAQQWRPAEVAAGPAPGIAYADLTTRIIAYIIDGIILGIAYSIIVGVLFAAIFFSIGGFLVYFVLSAALLGIGSAIYFVYTWTTMRASPGQKILNLQTVNEADGGTLSQNQAIMRWAYLFGPAAIGQVLSLSPYSGFGLGGGAILSLLISLAVLGYYIYLIYTTANDPKRQGFHDKQSKTVVVKATPAA